MSPAAGVLILGDRQAKECWDLFGMRNTIRIRQLLYFAIRKLVSVCSLLVDTDFLPMDDTEFLDGTEKISVPKQNIIKSIKLPILLTTTILTMMMLSRTAAAATLFDHHQNLRFLGFSGIRNSHNTP
jgi:hypothetical protein